MNITVTWITALLLVIVLILAVTLTQNNQNPENENWSQFECGFNFMNPTHIPFSFQFFLVAILFLIFDVEISMLLAYPLEPAVMNNNLAIGAFVFMLAVGLIYEWQNSNIDWSN